MNTRLSVTGGALRYEFLMQARRRSMWLVLVLVSALSALLWVAFIQGPETTQVDAIMYLAQFTAWFLPVGVGLVLADRLARDKKLHVDELLDTFPGSSGARLLGKYLGSTLASLLPVFILYSIGSVFILARFHNLQSLLLALAAFAAIPLPGMLFAAGFSVALPAFLKVPLYQLLFIVYWFWANLLSPRFKIPTPTGTMLNATGPWAQEAFFHYQWVFLRLNPTVWQGVLSIALLVGLGFAALLLFNRLFRRLLLWYVSLLAVLVLLLGLSIGITVPWILYTTVEHDLSSQLPPLARSWQSTPASLCPLALPGQGYMLACYDARGKILRSLGVGAGSESYFPENSLALTALRNNNGDAARDALDETGVGKVHFDLVFLGSPRPGIIRQALVVHKAGSNQILGVIQLGTTPVETLARRQTIVNIFFACIFLALLLGVPVSGWYLAKRALQPLQLAFQRQRDFIANVSHELRTPLALLRANADVLLRGRARLVEEDAQLLDDIVTEAVYMDKLTSNMLLLARIDAGQLHLEQDVLNLARIAEGVVRRAQALAERSEITLTFQSEESAHALGDHVLLEQTLLILLDNALKYTQPGGKVSLATFMQDAYACLRFNDTGVGIASNHLPHLGERFYRVDQARSREVNGNGLGLAIAQGIIDMHHGKLQLTSEPGCGTTVTILLPGVHRFVEKHSDDSPA